MEYSNHQDNSQISNKEHEGVEKKSKNEQKREEKAKKLAEQKAQKEAEKAKKTTEQAEDPVGKHKKEKKVEEELDPVKYHENRSKAVLSLKKEVYKHPYPHVFEVTHTHSAFIAEFSLKCTEFDKFSMDQKASVAGEKKKFRIFYNKIFNIR